MSEAVSLAAPRSPLSWTHWRARALAVAPTRIEALLALTSAALLIISFPDFNVWPLAWIGLIPLFVSVGKNPQPWRSFLLGWITGTVFFFGSCYWLTYAMVRYGGIPVWIAYPMLVPGALVLGLFPAACCLVLAHMIRRHGSGALLLAPLLWVALEWARLGITGQLWNAVGYSQAYVPALIQTAAWGSVYAVSFLIIATNAALSYLLLERTRRAVLISLTILFVVVVLIFSANHATKTLIASESLAQNSDAVVVALQPNVPMHAVDLSESKALVNRHLSMSESALRAWEEENKSAWNTTEAESNGGQGVESKALSVPRVIIWPESPMNFTYTNDYEFRELVARFATKNNAAVLFNSLEPAPTGGAYNSAVMVNEEGRMVAQYDKIRLLPFGEYVPLPRWLPGVNLVPVMVGDFTPGARYTLMPLGRARAGVFICFESAFPSVAREFTRAGADVLINISNDGYLGPTPVMRQHLANTVFRAVENKRTVLRVTNTGITARITARGEVMDATDGFKVESRTWVVGRDRGGETFYTKYGDLFVGLCAAASLLLCAASFRRSGRRPPASGNQATS